MHIGRNYRLDLEAVAQKKPWRLLSEIKPTAIDIMLYGRNMVDAGWGTGAKPIGRGFALSVKFNDRASASLLLDTGASGIVIGRKLAEGAGVVKIGDTYLGGIGRK